MLVLCCFILKVKMAKKEKREQGICQYGYFTCSFSGKNCLGKLYIVAIVFSYLYEGKNVYKCAKMYCYASI